MSDIVLRAEDLRTCIALSPRNVWSREGGLWRTREKEESAVRDTVTPEADVAPPECKLPDAFLQQQAGPSAHFSF